MEKHYKISDAAEILGVKVRTIRQWIHEEKIKAVKYPGGKHWFISESEIRRMQDGDKN